MPNSEKLVWFISRTSSASISSLLSAMNRSNESTSAFAFCFASSLAPASINSSTEMSSMSCSI